MAVNEAPEVDPSIDVKHLRIAYPIRRGFKRASGESTHHVDALQDVSFNLKHGDRLGLLGRNGSGKSTLLKALAGIYPPSGGTITIKGKVASIFNASLGFVPQATGYENILLRGTLLGMSYDQVQALIPYVTEFSELGDWLTQPVASYSSGMALRLAFAITTAVESDILLLDEWLGAGDAQFLRKARARMSELVERAGILVLATHNLGLMKNTCNKVAVIDEGKLVHFGPADDIIPLYQKTMQQKRRELLA
ncbi:ABC transporter ATP-binding protein [Maricaulis maris]|uniref:ABC transporter ATP-binding protein n=1 Tax=Maricaulis maris TaxID=74318 RepID=UPI003BAC28CC